MFSYRIIIIYAYYYIDSRALALFGQLLLKQSSH